jgi:probable HAF family extracellular repeat protein
MRFQKVYLLLLLLASSGLVPARAANQSTFHFVQCPQSPETHLNGVNNNNAAVGYCLGADGVFHGLFAANGKLSFLDAPKGLGGTFPEDINSGGTIVGFYLDESFNHHAFSYANGRFSDLDPPGSTLAIAFGIDDLGRVTGEAEDLSSVFHGWVFDGAFHGVELGFGITSVRDINANNLATVAWQDQPPLYRSSLYHGGQFTDINVPGAISSLAHGINNAGDVVFSWTDDNSVDHGALLVGRKITKFDAPGCDTTTATGINDNHVIVGSCSASGIVQGFYVSY